MKYRARRSGFLSIKNKWTLDDQIWPSSGIQKIIDRQKEIVGDLRSMKIVFASGNEGKVREIREMLEGMGIELVSLRDYVRVPEIIEDGKSFLENALKKAKIISEFTGETVLADDSGLQVEA